MATIDELLAAVAACENRLVSRWNTQQDEDNYNAYIAGGSTGDVFLQRCIIWTNADGTFSRETVSIEAVDGAAYWDRLPRILWDTSDPGRFMEKLNAKITQALATAANVAFGPERIDPENGYAYGWVYVLNAEEKVEAHHKFASWNDTKTKIIVSDFVGEVVDEV